MNRTCAICGTESAAKTCPNCGEASWILIKRADEPAPEVVADPVAADEPAPRVTKKRRSRKS